jgi:hypothetical protein
MNDDALDIRLAQECAEFYSDPVGWVYWAFDWGHGDLQGQSGLDVWQEEYLSSVGAEVALKGFDGVNPVMPIRRATASGHGIGKSALVAMLILWLMSTRAHAKGIVTANTSDQLRTKTWGELAKWKKRCIVGHWFEYNNGKGSMSMYHRAHSETWRVDGVTCREENSEAFAGLHNSTSTPFYIFDEASAVPNSIWEVAEGGLTDGEPMIHAFGNPTRATGRFREAFSDSRWTTQQIDSRRARQTNKILIQEWIDAYGIDSDFVRVRVLGMFPKASDMQYFPTDVVQNAMRIPTPRLLPDEPLVCGIDYSRGGSDKCVIQFRRGKDARSEKRYEIPGSKTRDSIKLAALITTVLDRHRPDHIFGDVGSMGGPINDRLRQLGYDILDVGFGENAQDEQLYADRTSEMSYRLLEWLLNGGALPFVNELEQDLTAREFTHDKRDRLIMESKKMMKRRLGRSPDDMDALLLTFASKVAVSLPEGVQRGLEAPGHRDHDFYTPPAAARGYHPFDGLGRR